MAIQLSLKISRHKEVLESKKKSYSKTDENLKMLKQLGWNARIWQKISNSIFRASLID